MKGLLGFPKGSDDLETLLGLPKVKNLSVVPETLPFSDPQLWYDAADQSTITIATGVSSWANKGSSGVAAVQATGAAQPTFGSRKFGDRYVLDFDGVDDRLNATFTIGDRTATWFYAAQLDNGSAGSVVGTQGNNGEQIYFDASNSYLYDRVQGAADCTFTGLVAPVGPFVHGVIEDSGSATATARINSKQVGPVSLASINSTGNLAIMFSHVSGQVVIKGAVAEIIKYDYIMTADQFDLVMQYLGKKWDIEVNA